jgi:hypothetical protein
VTQWLFEDGDDGGMTLDDINVIVITRQWQHVKHQTRANLHHWNQRFFQFLVIYACAPRMKQLHTWWSNNTWRINQSSKQHHTDLLIIVANVATISITTVATWQSTFTA